MVKWINPTRIILNAYFDFFSNFKIVSFILQVQMALREMALCEARQPNCGDDSHDCERATYHDIREYWVQKTQDNKHHDTDEHCSWNCSLRPRPSDNINTTCEEKSEDNSWFSSRQTRTIGVILASVGVAGACFTFLKFLTNPSIKNN